MTLGKYAATIIACYAIVFGTFAAVIAWLVLEGRRLATEMATLERRGVRRRAAGMDPTSSESDARPEPNQRG